ncbi:MAG: histidine triad nucleotide-binding protein [Planctomycetaceae bacterium]|jgi:histidine triad (HIT) family protein|nr:histidine triad nucleotide-binding protein [Planctomycetaceae bacterium]
MIMAEKTIFKRIIDKDIPAKIVYEDDLCLAFDDAHPQAPVHVLLIPKKEIASLNQLTEEDTPLLGHLYSIVRKLVKELGLDNGYRLVVNCGDDGGQTVYHLHFHIFGGRPMSWPPG